MEGMKSREVGQSGIGFAWNWVIGGAERVLADEKATEGRSQQAEFSGGLAGRSTN